MIVLAIDTSTKQTSVALGTEREILGRFAAIGRSHERAVMPAIERLLEWTGTGLSQVGGIAVGVGPGLFTGLRVGVETGKALAQVLGTPVLGVASLDALAHAVRHTQKRIASVIDARRGGVFFAVYRPVPGGVVRETEPTVGPPQHLVGELEALGREVLAVGNGAILYRKELEELGGKVELASAAEAHPRASALVELSVQRFLLEEHDKLEHVRPIYLRKSDAEIAWDQRARGIRA